MLPNEHFQRSKYIKFANLYKCFQIKIFNFVFIYMKNLFFLNSYLFKYKSKLLIGGLLILIANFLSLFPAHYIGKLVALIKLILNNFKDRENLSFEEKKLLFFYGSSIVLLPIFGGFMKFFMRKILMRVSRKIEFDLKNRVFQSYQILDFKTLKKYSSGDLINGITEDITNIRTYLGPGLMLFFSLIVLFISVSIQMLRINLWLGIYALTPILIISVSIFYLSKRVYVKNKEVQENKSLFSSLIEDIFSGMPIIKSFCLEKYFQKKHFTLAQTYQKNNLKLTQVESFLSFVMAFFIGISYLSILYLGGKKYINEKIGLGELTEFFVYINMLSWPLNTFAWTLSTMQKASSSLKRIFFFLEEKDLLNNKRNKKFSFKEKIEIKDLNFSYKNKKIIRNISFFLKKGQILNIIGDNGSGKSTFVALFTGLFEYHSGHIFLDNQELKEISLKELRKNISVVSQENFLFSESIFENISSKELLKEDPLVRQSARNAQVEKDILGLKEGYESLIGKKGIELSGGQKQRISIARAFYKKAPILVFDDAFSAIDQRTKKNILEYIRENPYKQTIILLSLDKSFISYVDQIYFL